MSNKPVGSWAPAVSKPCQLVIRPVKCSALAEAAKFMRITLLPWNLQACSQSLTQSSCEPVWHATESLHFDYPGLQGEREACQFRVEVCGRKSGMFSKRENVVGNVAVETQWLFAKLAKENPLAIKLSLEKNGGSIQLVVAAAAVGSPAVPHNDMTTRVVKQELVGPRNAQNVDMSNLLDKLCSMYKNARVHIIGEGRQLSDSFRVYDKGNNGRISREDFVRVLRTLEFSLTVPEFACLVALLDCGKNQVEYMALEPRINSHMERMGSREKQMITEEEHMHDALGAYNPTKKKLQRFLYRAQEEGMSVRQVFSHFDRHGSGSISKQDFQLALKQLGLKLSIKDLVLLVNELDRNRDGFISLNEFQAFIALGEKSNPGETLSPSSAASGDSRSSSSCARGGNESGHDDALPPAFSRGDLVWARLQGGDKYYRAKVVRANVEEDGTYAISFIGSTGEANGVVKSMSNVPVRYLRTSPPQARGKAISPPREGRTSPGRARSPHARDVELSEANEMLARCRERLKELEERCAAAEADRHCAYLDGQRAQHRAAERERTAKRNLLYGEIASKLYLEFGLSAQDMARMGRAEREERNLQELAQVGLAEMLEKKIQDLTAANAALSKQISQESKRADCNLARAQRFEAYILSNKDLFAPRISNMGRRSSMLARRLFTKAAEEFSGDIIEMFRSLLPKDPNGNLIAPQNGHNPRDRHEEKCGRPERRTAENERLKHNGEEIWASLEVLQQLLIPHALSYEDAVELDREMTLAELGEEFLFPCQDRDLPEYLRHSRSLVAVVPFAAGLIKCKEWDIRDAVGRDKAIEGRPETTTWNPTSSSHETKLQEIDSKHPSSKRDDDKMLSLLSSQELLFKSFSETENSMNWAPLKTFGRVPFDCVRVLEPCQSVAEHNTSQQRSVMCFVQGSIKSIGRTSIFLRMEKSMDGSAGSWALCVTSGVPCNRPVRGSAIYFGNGEAKVEGAAELGKTVPYTDVLRISRSTSLLEKYAMIPKSVLVRARAESDSDDYALERVYSRFVPRSIVWERIADIATVVADKLDRQEELYDERRELDEEDMLVWKARELEAQLRMHHARALSNGVKRDHWDFDDAFGKALQDASFGDRRGPPTKLRGGKNGGRGRDVLRTGQVLAAGALLYRDYKELLRPDEWKGIVARLEQESDTSACFTFDAFMVEMQAVEREITKQFKASSTCIAHFRSLISKQISKQSKQQSLHFAPVAFGDTLGAVVDYQKGTVGFYVNGVHQTDLKPTCKKPWQFAWYTNRNSAARIITQAG